VIRAINVIRTIENIFNSFFIFFSFKFIMEMQTPVVVKIIIRVYYYTDKIILPVILLF